MTREIVKKRKLHQRDLRKIANYPAPLYKCEKEGKQLKFQCPYCYVEHYHGCNVDPFTPTHRNAHCRSTNPEAHKNGYYLYYEG